MDRVAHKLQKERTARIRKRLSKFYQECAIPKGKPRKAVKAKKDREDAKQLKAFRDGVWEREHNKMEPLTPVYYARCQGCATWVDRRKGASVGGQVDHIISRRHRISRYLVSNGRLLCRRCHNQKHGREF